MKLSKKPKVIVIGLDGATFKNLGPWIEQGLLPNLKFLIDNGVSGNLESTMPRHSAPAWSSFMTGVNPGKHGVFGFVKPFSDKEYKYELYSSQDIKTKTIFELLSDYGKISGAINLPMTYPPFKINGFMISCGLTTPSNYFDFTFPINLFEKIGFKKSEYILDINPIKYFKDEKEEELFLDLIRSEENKKEISFKLMDIYDWDLFVLIFGGTDRLQHFCWHYIDPTHSKYDSNESKKFLPFIIDYYQKLDAIIGEFMNNIDENTSLFIMSDHGFGPSEKRVSLHKILEKNKLLHYKKEPFLVKTYKLQKRVRGILQRNSLIYRKTKSIIKALLNKMHKKNFEEPIPTVNVKKRLGFADDSYWQTINWHKTLAYFGPVADSVCLNLKNREPEGIIDMDSKYFKIKKKIADIICNIYDPLQKRKLGVKVYEKEDSYIGTYSEKAPDIFFEIEDARYELQRGNDYKNIIEENHTPHTGKHTKDGILICYGRNFKGGNSIGNAKIIDIVPTILYILKCKIPEYMDGRVLTEIFSDTIIKNNPIMLDKTEQERKTVSQKNGVYSNHEVEKITKHLSDLGYL